MGLFQIMADVDCTGLLDVLSIVKWAFTWICRIVPIIIIIMAVLDVAKLVTSGNVDDKMKKEATQKLTTRVIYGVVIFLIPVLVEFLFTSIPVVKDQPNIISCWKQANI